MPVIHLVRVGIWPSTEADLARRIDRSPAYVNNILRGRKAAPLRRRELEVELGLPRGALDVIEMARMPEPDSSAPTPSNPRDGRSAVERWALDRAEACVAAWLPNWVLWWCVWPGNDSAFARDVLEREPQHLFDMLAGFRGANHTLRDLTASKLGAERGWLDHLIDAERADPPAAGTFRG